MKGSWKLGSFAGINLFVHWTFFILPAWIALSAYREGHDGATVGWNVLFVLAIFACVTLHEYGHALMARKYGYKTKNITLLPIGGVANMEAIPEEPRQEFNIAIAGPMVNVVISVMLYFYLQITGSYTIELENFKLGPDNFIFILMSANLFIAVFNMIPAFPMDGGRVLRALLSMKLTRTQATKITSAIGQIAALLFILIGFFANFFLIIIGVFVLLGARSEWFIEYSRFILGEHRVRDILIHKYQKLAADMTLHDAVNELLDNTEDHFLVMKENEVVGSINREVLLKAIEQNPDHTPLEHVMIKELNILHPDTLLSEVYNPQKKTFRTQGQLMPVVENNQLVGVLDLENIAEFIQLQTALIARKSKMKVA